MKKRILFCFLPAFLLICFHLLNSGEIKNDDAASANKKQATADLPAVSSKNGAEAKNGSANSALPSQTRSGDANGNESITFKNFSLNGKNRLVPEMKFSVQVLSADLKDRIIGIYLHADQEVKSRKIDFINIEKLQNYNNIQKLKAYFKQDGEIGKNEIIVCMPKWQSELRKLINPKFFDGCFKSHDAFLDIVYYPDKENKKTAVETIDVEIAEPFWAWIWGIAAIFISMGLARSILRKKLNGKSKISFFKVPLLMTETPTNRYSLSLTQLIIWTYITLFGLVFVWKMTQSFMEITPQILMLLGIGGGTAAFTRLQAAFRLQNIPYKYHKLFLSGDNPRKPKLADIISSGDGRPNLIKYQLITFTILIACIVFFEIVNKFVFPTLSDGLIALMGLSSAVYIGNDLGKNISEQDLQSKLMEMDKHLKDKDDAKTKEFKEFIENYLM